MSPRRRALGLAALSAAALAGCGTLSNEAPRFEFFVIEDLRPLAEPSSAPPRSPRSLLLTTGPAQALYDSDRIVFTRDGAGRAYYQYSNWSERPARRVLALAEARLARGGGLRSVAQTLAGVRGDIVLSLRLDELIHDDSASPGVVRAAVTAEMVDWRTRTLVARRTFVQRAPVPTRDARGAAAAANVAVTALLDELAPWVEASAASIRAAD
ncbi:MAG: ABC-type transport auxiliary lipoprotein family protein [Burkholderiales bacterium]|jgi:cholesterol transport system auxiliary component